MIFRKLSLVVSALLALSSGFILPPAVAAAEKTVEKTAGKTSEKADGDPFAALHEPGPFAVGVKTVVLVDASRDDPFAGGKRTLVTEIWYPAADSSRGDRKSTFGEFFGPYRKEAEKVLGRPLAEIETRFTTLAVRDAPLRRPRTDRGEAPYPLLVFSHGNGGFRHQNVFQMDHLASHGYIVMSPDHTGNSRLSPLPDRPVFYDRKGRNRSAEDRPRDVSFLIDHALAENAREGSWLHGAIDPGRIGVLGHSFGGYTACKVAATDPRVKAILPMTVAIAGFETAPAAVPTMVMLAAHDRTMRAAGNFASRGYYVACPGEKYLLTLKRGGHFTYCEMGTLDPDFGDGIGRGKGLDDKVMDFIPVPLAKEIIDAYTLAFFDRHLLGSKLAGEFLSANHYPEEMDYLHEGPAKEAPRAASGSGSDPALARTGGRSGTDPAGKERSTPPRVLVITGEDVPAHRWRETTAVTRAILEENGTCTVRVCEESGILESDAIHAYDVLVLNFRNNFKVHDLGERTRRNLTRFAGAGKGIVAIHFAVAAFQNWPGYRDLIGRVWVRKRSGHGPRGPFRAVIADSGHFITRGMEDFEIDDELYALLEGERPIDVLVKGFSPKSNRDEPLVWTVRRDTGRVVCIALGHDARARQVPAFRRLLRRSVLWAAGDGDGGR